MADGCSECGGDCINYDICDWEMECGVCATCPAYPDWCDGKGECYKAKNKPIYLCPKCQTYTPHDLIITNKTNFAVQCTKCMTIRPLQKK